MDKEDRRSSFNCGNNDSLCESTSWWWCVVVELVFVLNVKGSEFEEEEAGGEEGLLLCEEK